MPTVVATIDLIPRRAGRTRWQRCGTCREVKPLADFPADESRPSGISATCSACPQPNCCLRCGRPGKQRARGICPACYYVAKAEGSLDDWPRLQRRNADVVEDAAELIAAGEHPQRAAERMGMTCAAVSKACYRAGRPDLGAPFNAVAKRSTRAPLPSSCGQL